MDLNLHRKAVLITGGTQGIGRACAELLATEGCDLHLVARSREDLQETRNVIRAAHRVSVEIYPRDLSVGEQARDLAAACPQIDVLINNAGAIPQGDLWQVDEPRWREAWDLKVFGYINLCRAVYPQMKSLGRGVIVNVIGGAGERPRLNYIAGGAGNAALMAFTRALGARSLKDGIRVVAVNPGLIRTARLEKLLRTAAETRFSDPDRWQELIPSDPPPGNPEDIANMVVFLASQRAGYVSGTVVTVDGGATAR